MNYTLLKQAIQDYVQSSEATFVTHLDDFITQAEQRLAQLVRAPDTRLITFATANAGDVVMTNIPVFIAINNVFATADGTTLIPMLQKEESWILTAYPDQTTRGAPRYYSTFQLPSPTLTTLRIGPAADQSYTFQVEYFGQPASIITNGTSWYGNNATDALLYHCLVEAYGYLKGETDMLTFYKGKADEATARVQRMVEGLQKVDTYRNQDIRRPIQ